MAINYAAWPLDKLKKEKDKIEKVIKSKQVREKKAVIAKMAAVAKSSGFDFQELINEGAGKKSAASKNKPAKKKKVGAKRGPVAPKYQNPDDKSQQWTGRGRQPRWVQAQLKNGRSLQDMAI